MSKGRTWCALLLTAALLLSSAALPAAAEDEAGRIVIACVGDSLTEGIGSTNAAARSYPAVLQTLLGDRYRVVNCGAAGTTLLSDNGAPCYRRQSRFRDSRQCSPDAVIVMLGTNDAKPAYQAYHDRFVAQMTDLIGVYRGLSSAPKVYIATSPAVTETLDGITDAVVSGKIVPLQRQAAAETDCPVIDINAATAGKSAWSFDGVHLTDEGYRQIAAVFADALSAEFDPAIVRQAAQLIDRLPQKPNVSDADRVADIRFIVDSFTARQKALLTAEQLSRLAAAEQAVAAAKTAPATAAGTTAPSQTVTSPTRSETSAGRDTAAKQPETTAAGSVPTVQPSADPDTTAAPPPTSSAAQAEPHGSAVPWAAAGAAVVLAAAGAGIYLFIKKKRGGR